VHGLFPLQCAECINVFFALCTVLAGDVVYRGGTSSFYVLNSGVYSCFNVIKSGVDSCLVCVEVFFNGLNRADEFIQELFGGLCISLVADERLVVGIYRFCLASDCGNQFH
jgi:hypothetical protein